jgi:C4-dicarboxylate-specific signal transduction histidine kinase
VHDELERRVEARTADASADNEKLREELAEREEHDGNLKTYRDTVASVLWQ